MMIDAHPQSAAGIEIELVTDPAELAAAQRQREQFERNSAWLERHTAEVYRRYPGQFICVAGEQVFASGEVQDAVAQARSVHPGDDGYLTRFIPAIKAPRIYAI